MSWLGLLLVGLSCADLLHSAGLRPRAGSALSRWLPGLGGTAAVLVLALLAGVLWSPAVLGVLAVVGATLAWAWAVPRGFGRERHALPLVVLAVAVGLAVLLAGTGPDAGWLLEDWLEASTVPVLGALSAERFLLLLGGLLAQLSTGNVVVRLVFGVTDTVHPARDGSLPATPLKGGRLLGPMERVLILGLGMAGEITAAGIVIAAKGLLRFPELSSAREQAEVHRLTEYFLVGSFVSWVWALGSLALVAG